MSTLEIVTGSLITVIMIRRTQAIISILRITFVHSIIQSVSFYGPSEFSSLLFSSRSLWCERAMSAFSRFLFTHNNTLGFGLLFPLYIYCRSIDLCSPQFLPFFSVQNLSSSIPLDVHTPIRIVVANRMHFDWKHNCDQVVTKWSICKTFECIVTLAHGAWQWSVHRLIVSKAKEWFINEHESLWCGNPLSQRLRLLSHTYF